MYRLMIAASLLTGAALGGCTGTAMYSVNGDVYTPDLVEVEPGVQVIADYDEPVFYSDNYYWRSNGGRWERSNTYNRGWVSASPPTVILSINQPDRYRHYRPAGYVPRQQRNNGPQVRDHRDNQPEVRDHRENQPGPVVRDHRDNPPPPQPGPVVRDHRDDDRDRGKRKEEPKAPVVRDHN